MINELNFGDFLVNPHIWYVYSPIIILNEKINWCVRQLQLLWQLRLILNELLHITVNELVIYLFFLINQLFGTDSNADLSTIIIFSIIYLFF